MEDQREKIVKDHPLLYPEGMTFECMDGWLDIIEELSDKLERELEKLEVCKWGYRTAHAVQVKEKFGGLRFYMSTETEHMSQHIREAEDRSYETCEVCGKPGKVKPAKWLVVRCEEHS